MKKWARGILSGYAKGEGDFVYLYKQEEFYLEEILSRGQEIMSVNRLTDFELLNMCMHDELDAGLKEFAALLRKEIPYADRKLPSQYLILSKRRSNY